MKLAIVGSREHPRLTMVEEYVLGLPDGTVLISGGAAGVDITAQKVGRNRGFLVRAYPPHNPSSITTIYGGHGPSHIIEVSTRDQLLYRNTLIALDCDEMVLFPDGSKGGCWDSAREALRFKRKVWVHQADGRIYEYLGGHSKKSVSPQVAMDFG